MSTKRILRAAVVLTVVAAFSAASPCAGIGFLEPADGALVLGATTFRFDASSPDGSADRIDLYDGERYLGSALPPAFELTISFEQSLDGNELTAIGIRSGEVVGTATLHTATVGFMERVRVDLVQLYPTVLQGGRYVRNLKQSDFRIYEDGREMEIRYFTPGVDSLSIAIVLDVSSSMTRRLGTVQDSSLRFVEQLRPDDAAALYSFNHKIHRHVPMTTDRGVIREHIWRFQAGGSTAVYDSLIEVIREISEVPGRKAIFLFSDGADELSLASIGRCVNEAAQAEIVVYAVGIVTGATTGHRGRSRRDDLVELANGTGGKAWFMEDTSKLPRVFEEILVHLRSQYVLGYIAPGGPTSYRTIEVTVENPRYRVNSRPRYLYDSGRGVERP